MTGLYFPPLHWKILPPFQIKVFFRLKQWNCWGLQLTGQLMLIYIPFLPGEFTLLTHYAGVTIINCLWPGNLVLMGAKTILSLYAYLVVASLCICCWPLSVTVILLFWPDGFIYLIRVALCVISHSNTSSFLLSFVCNHSSWKVLPRRSIFPYQ